MIYFCRSGIFGSGDDFFYTERRIIASLIDYRFSTRIANWNKLEVYDDTRDPKHSCATTQRQCSFRHRYRYDLSIHAPSALAVR